VQEPTAFLFRQGTGRLATSDPGTPVGYEYDGLDRIAVRDGADFAYTGGWSHGRHQIMTGRWVPLLFVTGGQAVRPMEG
jgi:hypothetical protein